jgi:hypothetical protein
LKLIDSSLNSTSKLRKLLFQTCCRFDIFISNLPYDEAWAIRGSFDGMLLSAFKVFWKAFEEPCGAGNVS